MDALLMHTFNSDNNGVYSAKIYEYDGETLRRIGWTDTGNTFQVNFSYSMGNIQLPALMLPLTLGSGHISFLYLCYTFNGNEGEVSQYSSNIQTSSYALPASRFGVGSNLKNFNVGIRIGLEADVNTQFTLEIPSFSFTFNYLSD